MSYARFGWDNSDVYVFLSVGGFFDCCGCLLRDIEGHKVGQDIFSTTEDLIAHLKQHEEAGHKVPDYCYERLREEAEENDAWIERYKENPHKASAEP